ncbi:MAG: sigma-70 family RNA polymerase sigma factor [Planctomycetota bacterium]
MEREARPHRRLSEVERLLLMHSERIKAFLHALVPDQDLAEDLFQEVFITAVDKSADFRSGTDFLAWIRAIARNKVLDALRRQRRRRRRHPLLEPHTIDLLVNAAPAVDDVWDRHRVALRRCLQDLPERLRTLLRQRYAEDQAPVAIARAHSSSAGAISVALHRARRALRGCIRQRLLDEVAP